MSNLLCFKIEKMMYVIYIYIYAYIYINKTKNQTRFGDSMKTGTMHLELLGALLGSGAPGPVAQFALLLIQLGYMM